MSLLSALGSHLNAWSGNRFHKYLKVYTTTLTQAVSYRAELLLWAFLDIGPTILLFLVWQTVFATHPENQGYNLHRMIEFYFYFMVINSVISSHFEDNYVQLIREGKIDLFLTRPLSFLANIFCRTSANKTFFLALFLPGATLIYILCRWVWRIQFSPLSLAQLGQVLLLMAVGFTIEYLIGLIIVLVGFWNDGAAGLEHFKWIVITMLGGTIVPRLFLPGWLKSLVNLFPFQYMYAVPIEIAQGLRQLQWQELGYVLAFVALELLIVKILWRQAAYKYTSFGG